MVPVVAVGQAAGQAAPPGSAVLGPSTAPTVRQKREVISPSGPANLPETLRLYLPDPLEAKQSFEQRLANYKDAELRREFENIIRRTTRVLGEYERKEAVRLSLHDAIRRAPLRQLRDPGGGI